MFESYNGTYPFGIQLVGSPAVGSLSDASIRLERFTFLHRETLFVHASSGRAPAYLASEQLMPKSEIDFIKHQIDEVQHKIESIGIY